MADSILYNGLNIHIEKINNIYYISYDICSFNGYCITEDNFKTNNIDEVYDTIDYIVNTLRPRPLY